MKIICAKDLKFIPASHEDPKNPGVLKRVLFKKEDLPKGKIQMINWSKLLVGKSVQLHHHEDMDEVFVIMNGKVEVRIGKEADILEKGDAVLAPKKKTHTMKNISDEDVSFIALGISQGIGGKTIIDK